MSPYLDATVSDEVYSAHKSTFEQIIGTSFKDAPTVYAKTIVADLMEPKALLNGIYYPKLKLLLEQASNDFKIMDPVVRKDLLILDKNTPLPKLDETENAAQLLAVAYNGFLQKAQNGKRRNTLYVNQSFFSKDGFEHFDRMNELFKLSTATLFPYEWWGDTERQTINVPAALHWFCEQSLLVAPLADTMTIQSNQYMCWKNQLKNNQALFRKLDSLQKA